MSDDLNDERIVLASAYLDNAVTSAERDHVDADPALLAEVERLRTIRASLSNITDTPISTRERHLAAALSAWDRLSDSERSGDNSGGLSVSTADPAAAAGAATVTAPTQLTDRRGRRSGQKSGWLLTAAAAILVLAGGGLIARGVTSGTEDSSAATESAAIPAQRDQLSEVAADETFADDAEAADEPAADEFDLAPQAEAGIDSTTGRPDDLETIDSPEALAAFAVATLAAEARVDADASEAASDSNITADAAEASPIEDAPAETDAPAEEAAAENSPTAGGSISNADRIDPQSSGAVDLTCDLVDRIIADIEYGTGLFRAPVALGVNADETEAIAYRVETCEIVARTALPG